MDEEIPQDELTDSADGATQPSEDATMEPIRTGVSEDVRSTLGYEWAGGARSGESFEEFFNSLGPSMGRQKLNTPHVGDTTIPTKKSDPLESESFWDLETPDMGDPDTDIVSSHENRTVFTPRVIPVPMTPPPPVKRSFFGTLKGTVAKVISPLGTGIKKYWKQATTLGVAAALATAVDSKAKKDTPSSFSSQNPTQTVSIPEENKTPSIVPTQLAITPEPDLSQPSEREGTASVVREMTPLEKELQVSEIAFSHSTDENLSLAEIVLGKKILNPPKVVEEIESIIEAPEEPGEPFSITETAHHEDMPTTPMYVFSNGKKTTYITDRDNDGLLSVDEARRAYFETVGGNRKKNTKKMYKMADELGLNSDNIKPGNLRTTIQYSDIVSDAPVVKVVTVGGKSYTISANTELALRLGEERLTRTEIIQQKNDSDTDNKDTLGASATPPLPKSVARDIPTAIPVLEELSPKGGDSILSGDVVSLLPDRGTILPEMKQGDIGINQRAQSYRGTLAYVVGNGRYEGSSRILFPDTQEGAQAVIEGILGTVDAIREASRDEKQRHISLQQFYTRHITFVDKNQKPIAMSLATFLRKHADYTDLQIAQAMGNKTPPNIVDNNPRDNNLAGTFDMNGWVATKKLIETGAKKIYGEYASIKQIEEYTRQNASFEKYPGITYRDILKKAREEERMEEERAVKKSP